MRGKFPFFSPPKPEAPSAPAPAIPDSGKPKPLKPAAAAKTTEIGGPSGPEPTRYGDWERNGKVSDF